MITREIDFNDLSNFTDKQKEADRATSDYKYILYGGAMGGGKSYWLRWEVLKLLMLLAQKHNKRGIRAGLFCEDYPALKDRHLSRIMYEWPEWLGNLNKSEHEYTLKPEYGAGVVCFRNLDDPSKYQSSEFAIEAVDELTKNPKETFDFLRTRLRWPGIDDTKFLSASNPGGIGHAWVKGLWMDKVFEPTESEQDKFCFIRATALDNPYLSKSYFDSLKGLPEEMRRAYIEGDWNLFKGQYFTEWRDERHTVEPFAIPDSWKKYRAYDHGRDKPACCKWYAVDYDGRIWVYREFYQAGLNIDQIASEINRLSVNEYYDFSVADPSIFANTGFIDKSGGQTIAETFARYGVMFMPASNRRVDGWQLMHQYLYFDDNNAPKMLYFKTCKESIRTLPSLIHDDIRPEDLDTGGEDHAADTDRYMLMAMHERKTAKPLSEIELKLLKFKEQYE